MIHRYSVESIICGSLISTLSPLKTRNVSYVVCAATITPLRSVKAAFESYFGQPKGQRILIVGCGLSTIASQMHALGYRCITAIDISATAIAHMQAGDQDKEGIECKQLLFNHEEDMLWGGSLIARAYRGRKHGNWRSFGCVWIHGGILVALRALPRRNCI